MYPYLPGSSELHLVSERRRVLAEGVCYLERSFKNKEGLPVETYIVTVAPDSPARAVVWGAPQGQTKTVPVQAEEVKATGRRVLAAVNADYFHLAAKTLTTYGAQIIDGRVIVEPEADRERHGDYWFGMTEDGRYVIGNATEYYQKYKGNLSCAVGGGPPLLVGGKAAYSEEKPRKCGPRTTVGISPEGGLAIVCADGRSAASAGINFADQNWLFLDLDMNITEVLNFDGGGSTTVVIENEAGTLEVTNVPSDTPMRPVADILAVVLPEK